MKLNTGDIVIVDGTAIGVVMRDEPDISGWILVRIASEVCPYVPPERLVLAQGLSHVVGDEIRRAAYDLDDASNGNPAWHESYGTPEQKAEYIETHAREIAGALKLEPESARERRKLGALWFTSAHCRAQVAARVDEILAETT